MNEKLFLGAHLSCAKGFYKMGKEALSAQMNTMQFFLRNPRGAKAKALDPDDMAAFRTLLTDNSFAPVIAHAPYTLNPCSPDAHIRGLAEEMFADDLQRMEHIPGNLYNFHPGSRLKQPLEIAVAEIAELLNRLITPELHTTILLETMSGKGSEVGRDFQELRAILDRIEHPEKVGVCLDTCHVWDAGYDIGNDLDGVLTEFDRIIGLQNLKAIHLNDSLNACGSHKDRHALIGQGEIGFDALLRAVTHPALRGLPFTLETPTDTAGHAAEIAVLREAVEKIG
ncbi:MAG: deoxyribonuclease IV [Lachnospiraceae bacterium]